MSLSPRLAPASPPPHSPLSRDAGLVLSLSESAETLELWPHRFRLQLTVRLSAASLTMTLVASNTGHAAFDFQALRGWWWCSSSCCWLLHACTVPRLHTRHCCTPTSV